MYTILFVEEEKDKGRMVVGFHLDKQNLFKSPKGQIHIARFTSSFCPNKNRGYYGDIFMKRMIKRWKKRKMIKTIQLCLLNKLCYDTINNIINYLI